MKKHKKSPNVCFKKYTHNICSSSCFDWIEIGDFITEGSTSSIYSVSLNGKEYIAKIMILDTDIPSEFCDYHGICEQTTMKEFQKEVKLSKLMGENDIGPKVISVINCKALDTYYDETVTIGVIVMEKFNTNAANFLKFANDDGVRLFYQKLIQRLEEMYKLTKIVHSDLHPENVFVEIDDDTGDIIDVKLIDFGPNTFKGDVGSIGEAIYLFKRMK